MALGGSFSVSSASVLVDGATSDVSVAMAHPSALTGDDYLLTITGAASYTFVASFRRSHGQCRRGRPRHYAFGAGGDCG